MVYQFSIRTSFLIWLGLGLSAAAGQTPSTPFENAVAGKIEIATTANSTANFDYQFGEVSDAPEKSVVHGLESVQSSLNLNPTVLYFAEEGSAVGPSAELTQRFTVEVIRIPHSLIEAYGRFSQYCRKVSAECVVPAKAPQKAAGYFFGTLRAAVTGYAWYSSGVSPLLVIQMAAVGGLLTGWTFRYSDTFQNLYNYNALPKNVDEEQSRSQKIKVFGRQMLFDLTVGNLLNALGGMRLGLGRNSFNIGLGSSVNAAFGIQKSKWLKGRLYLNTALAIVTAPLSFALQAYEAVNHPKGIFTVHSINFMGPPVAISLGVTASIMVAVQAKPELVARVLDKVYRKFSQITGSAGAELNQASDSFCDQVLKGVSIPGQELQN